MKYLLSMGLPPNVQDIAGLTPLHHTAMSSRAPVELSRMLLQSGAAVNHQNRYGEVPILISFQLNEIQLVDLFMEFGAGMEIETADQVTPSNCFLRFGPQVTATVRKWIRKRNGEEVPMDEKRCQACHKGEPQPGDTRQKLMMCSKCHAARYCSSTCQREFFYYLLCTGRY